MLCNAPSSLSLSSGTTTETGLRHRTLTGQPSREKRSEVVETLRRHVGLFGMKNNKIDIKDRKYVEVSFNEVPTTVVAMDAMLAELNE